MDSVLKPHLPHLPRPGSGNLRAYLAGTGATGALIGGALVVFLSAIAFVAFNGFSFPGSGDESSISISSTQPARLAQAPIAAAAAVGPGAGAVAAAPTPVAGPSGAVGPGALPPGVGPGTGDDTPTGGSSSNGPISNVVDGIDDTAPPGVLPPLSDTTDPVTDPADGAVRDTLNQAPVGGGHLGDDVSNGVNNTTDRIIGNGGPLGGN